MCSSECSHPVELTVFLPSNHIQLSFINQVCMSLNNSLFSVAPHLVLFVLVAGRHSLSVWLTLSFLFFLSLSLSPTHTSYISYSLSSSLSYSLPFPLTLSLSLSFSLPHLHTSVFITQFNSFSHELFL